MKKRSDGRYQANIYIGTENGKRKFKTIYAQSKQELKNMKEDMSSAVRKGTYADDHAYMLGEYLSKQETFLLFGNKSGQLMSKTSFRCFWNVIYRKLVVASGGSYHREGKNKKIVYDINPISGITPHYFRHNFATMLYYSGVDLKEAIRIMGHSDSKILLDIYTHLQEKKSDSRRKIEKMLMQNKA